MSVYTLYNKKRNLLPLKGKWRDAFGTPELRGSWFIWGESASGKTTLILEICKMLTPFSRVLYNSLEEGDSESFKLSLQKVKMEEVGTQFLFLDKEPIATLMIRLRRHKAPKVVVIDSIQYAQMSVKQYHDMLKEFPDTLFIINSHAEGKQPEGKVAKKIRYDAMIKIYVVGYVAFCKSRYLKEKSVPIVIWPEEAEKYHGPLDQLIENNQ